MYIIKAWLQKEMAGVSVCVHSRSLRDQIATAKDDEEEDLRFQRDAAAAALGFHAVKHHNEAQQMQHVCRKPEDIHLLHPFLTKLMLSKMTWIPVLFFSH